MFPDTYPAYYEIKNDRLIIYNLDDEILTFLIIPGITEREANQIVVFARDAHIAGEVFGRESILRSTAHVAIHSGGLPG